jgi:DNA-binding MarR family transcriptional regulator
MAKSAAEKRAGRVLRASPERAKSPMLSLLKQVQYRSFLLLEQALAPLNVSAVQFRILTTVKQRRRISSAELARLYDVRPQTMFKQVAVLESSGLIRRGASVANKRILELELSPAGERVLAECALAASALEQELFAGLTGGELGMFGELMTRMLKAAREKKRAKPLAAE